MIISLVTRYYYVYILSNKEKSIYNSGTTGDWSLSLKQWKDLQCMPVKNDCIYLIYFEKYKDVITAVNRELAIRHLSHKRKELLIKSLNPNLDFLDERAKDEFEVVTTQ